MEAVVLLIILVYFPGVWVHRPLLLSPQWSSHSNKTRNNTDSIAHQLSAEVYTGVLRPDQTWANINFIYWWTKRSDVQVQVWRDGSSAVWVSVRPNERYCTWQGLRQTCTGHVGNLTWYVCAGISCHATYRAFNLCRPIWNMVDYVIVVISTLARFGIFSQCCGIGCPGRHSADHIEWIYAMLVWTWV